MNRMKAVYRVLGENDNYKCGRVGCGVKAVALVTDIHQDGTKGVQCAYCAIHFGEYANNGILDLSEDK